jgi:hypothetical protein
MDQPLPPTTQDALPLPGLDVATPGTGELETQVRRSLRFMVDQGLVDDRHAGLMQLALTLARAIRPGERAYGVAQAAAQLLATFDKLLPDPEGGDSDGFSELRAYLDGVAAAGSGT